MMRTLRLSKGPWVGRSGLTSRFPRVLFLGICSAVCFAVQSYTAFAAGPPGCETDGTYVMGTVLQVTLCLGGSVEMEAAGRTSRPMQNVFELARRYDTLFTTHADDSPIGKLNARAGQGAQSVPDEVADVLKLAQRYAMLTRGAFDVTVRPLLRVWREAAHTGQPPSPTALTQALRLVGSHKILFPAAGSVALSEPGMALDLGGIGKGYALDRMIERLRGQGVTDALLNFGQSSLWALGRPTDAAGWRLALRRPDGGIAGFVTLADRALSVSASLGQNQRIAEKRYGHVIDPRTGRAVERDLLACVVAPSAAQAEALSTALVVLGEVEGLALVEGMEEVEVLLLDANDNQWMTTGWGAATRFEAGLD